MISMIWLMIVLYNLEMLRRKYICNGYPADILHPYTRVQKLQMIRDHEQTQQLKKLECSSLEQSV